MSLDPFDVVTVRKAGRSTPSVGRSRTQEDDDPFAVVQVQRPKALAQGQVKDVSPLKVGAPSFKQFADAGAELPAAPPPTTTERVCLCPLCGLGALVDRQMLEPWTLLPRSNSS